MQGILSLIDPPRAAQVRALWDELEAEFGLKGVKTFPYPHVSFHLLDGYRREVIEERLHDTVSRFKPLTLHTAGLGLFTQPAPVLYIPVVRCVTLERIHRLLWKAFPPLDGSGGFYAPEHWLPHITLAVGDLTHAQLPGLFSRLGARDFHWEFVLDNLTFAAGTPQGLEIECSCKFGG